MNVAIINYGMGNLGSVRRAFEELGVAATIADHPTQLFTAHRIVLPGVGAFGEAIFSDHTNWVLGPQIRWHVRRGFWLGAEPALELAVEEEEEHEIEHEPEREARAIFRIATGYDFELGRWSVGPSLSVDVSKEKPAWVWGISVGTGFP